jgi:hypothetical protein
MVNPTVGLQSTVNIIHINNINTNLMVIHIQMYFSVLKQTVHPWRVKTHHLASNTNSLFKVKHQNIRGLKDKVQEFTTSLFPELSYILHLTNYHLKEDEIDMTTTENYNL